MALAPRLAPGSVFAREYRIVDLLAEGGMGAVYRAEQLSTRKPRALKLVSTRLATDPKGRQRFVREATVGASIDSEHVVEVIGAGIDDETGRPWLAMELLDGADLGAVVQHQGPLSSGQLREVVGQLCHGLAAAHRAGVVHRDLKPANVFVARSRRAGVPFTLKILDFGIAKVVQESGSGGTDTDTVGSPLWMAPEQLDAQRPSPATDVWALGLLAFWALTGKHYWLAAHSDSSTVQALFVEQLFKPIDPPSRRAHDLGAALHVPPGFDAWFQRCLAREPARRIPDAWTAGEELRALLPADPESAARLLPEVALPPSIGPTEPHRRDGESTIAAESSRWEASVVLPASALAAARTAFDGDATRADSQGLGAELSRAPLSSQATASTPRGGVSTVAVALSVALVASAVLGGGYLAWQRGWFATEPSSTAASERAPEPTEPAPTEPDPGATTASTDSTDHDPDPQPTSADGDELEPTPDEDDDPALALVVPMRTQLDHDAHEIRVLGWSEAGHRFVLEVEHRADRQPKPPALDPELNRLTLIQVHDALSGAMVESFLVAREAGPGISRTHPLSKAAAEARPKAEWDAVRKALRLRKPAPQRTGPGDRRLQVHAEDPPPGTALSLPPSTLGLAFRWSVDPTVALQSADRDAPELEITLERGEERWPLLELSPPFSSHRIAAVAAPGGDDPAVVGRLMAYWSPDGARVLLRLEIDARPPGDPPLRHQRWALRAAGPQIRLVEAGAGQRRTRQLAAQLAAAGLPVAVVDLRAPASAESKVIYDRAHERAAALAGRVRAALPVQPEPLPRRFTRDFVEVIVILGHDAA